MARGGAQGVIRGSNRGLVLTSRLMLIRLFQQTPICCGRVWKGGPKGALWAAGACELRYATHTTNACGALEGSRGCIPLRSHPACFPMLSRFLRLALP